MKKTPALRELATRLWTLNLFLAAVGIAPHEL
jgi:hypothetical protein